MTSREVTKLELLLGIGAAMYSNSHFLLYLPSGVHYLSMLTKLRSEGFVDIDNPEFPGYSLSEKAFTYIKQKDITKFSELDKEIDQFVDRITDNL